MGILLSWGALRRLRFGGDHTGVPGQVRWGVGSRRGATSSR